MGGGCFVENVRTMPIFDYDNDVLVTAAYIKVVNEGESQHMVVACFFY